MHKIKHKQSQHKYRPKHKKRIKLCKLRKATGQEGISYTDYKLWQLFKTSFHHFVLRFIMFCAPLRRNKRLIMSIRNIIETNRIEWRVT